MSIKQQHFGNKKEGLRTVSILFPVPNAHTMYFFETYKKKRELHRCGVMFSVLASSVVDRVLRAPVGSNQRLYNWNVLLLRKARSITEKVKR